MPFSFLSVCLYLIQGHSSQGVGGFICCSLTALWPFCLRNLSRRVRIESSMGGARPLPGQKLRCYDIGFGRDVLGIRSSMGGEVVM